MPSRKIADRLISARAKREREKILSQTAREDDIKLAHELKNICYEVWTSEPAKAQKTARALENLTKINPNEEIRALGFWVAGIAELTKGKLEISIQNLDKSAALFRKIKQPHEAASAQVAKLIALALLGKYAQAVKTGKAALAVFEQYGDELAAGKIEKNLGNIIARQNDISSAEKYYLSAMRRFEKVNNFAELTMCETNLADNFADLNDFVRAEKYYALALGHARETKMFFVEAETEASMGNLAMFRGKYGEALRFLELARQKFENLGITHRSVVANLEIAEIYQTLNLADEAFEIYGNVSQKLRKLKLQGDEAKARANFGRVALAKKDYPKARNELEKSARLYALEKNPGGLADVKLAEANLEFSRKNFAAALEKIREAEKFLTRSENVRQKLFAKWLHGEILQNLGRLKSAEKILLETYEESLKQELSNLALACLNSLGNLVLRKDERQNAESYFKRAVRMIETLRAPLAAEEFRMAFLSDKLAPFENLAKIYLAENDLEKAFSLTEKARARTLSESLSGDFLQATKTAKGSKHSQKLEDLREELNWFYSRLNRAEAGEFSALQKEAKKREKQIAALMRQIESTRDAAADVSAQRQNVRDTDEIRLLQKSLGRAKALIEFTSSGGSLSAFVLTNEKIDFAANLVDENEILSLLEGLQFQFGALRYGAKNLGAFLGELKNRADFYLRGLYEKLVRPLEDLTGERDLVIIPVGATHYVPFHALRRTDEKYLVETREIVYAPSAAVWRFLNKEPTRTIKNALLIGFADEKIPLVNHEIEAVQEIFPVSETFTGEAANFSNYRQNASKFDVLHMACHGQFRPENPLFSSLHLADGFVTVRDICSQNLNAALVTLSACETGLNKIYAGDEILGLARGFLSAGAKSLVLSLWTVSDEATVRLMKDFYTNLQRGESVAASLRLAQISFIKNGSHPYFWSPFMAIGK